MVASQEKKLLSVDDLDGKTSAELVRDIACSVFFGYYDERKGYLKLHLEEGEKNLGIYGFFLNVKHIYDTLKEYEENYFTNYDDVNEILKDTDILKEKYHTSFVEDFNDLIYYFPQHISEISKRYKVILNDNFIDELLPAIFDEIYVLCNIFITNIIHDDDDDIYNIKAFSCYYINNINLFYQVDVLPTIPEIYRKNERGESVLYAKQSYEYDNNGEIVKITTTLSDEFGGNVLIRYRDTLI